MCEFGTADVLDAPQLFRHRFRPEIVRPHRIDEAERAALLAGAVVREHQDQRVVADSGLLKERDQPRQMPVGVVEHAGIGGLQPREQPLLVIAVLVPGFDAVIARRHPGFRRHDSQRLLARQPLFALDVPAVCEHLVVWLDDVGGGLVRRMAGAERDPGQPGQIGPVGDVIGDEADRLVDQVRRQMIATGIAAERIDVGVVRHQLRRVLVGLGVEKAVEAVEAAAERPAVERPGGAAFGQRRHMPFADHVVAIGMRPQHFGERSGLAGDLAAIAGIAAVEIGKAADADGMVVAPGQ